MQAARAVLGLALHLTMKSPLPQFLNCNTLLYSVHNWVNQAVALSFVQIPPAGDKPWQFSNCQVMHMVMIWRVINVCLTVNIFQDDAVTIFLVRNGLREYLNSIQLDNREMKI